MTLSACSMEKPGVSCGWMPFARESRAVVEEAAFELCCALECDGDAVEGNVVHSRLLAAADADGVLCVAGNILHNNVVQ